MYMTPTWPKSWYFVVELQHYFELEEWYTNPLKWIYNVDIHQWIKQHKRKDFLNKNLFNLSSSNWKDKSTFFIKKNEESLQKITNNLLTKKIVCKWGGGRKHWSLNEENARNNREEVGEQIAEVDDETLVGDRKNIVGSHDFFLHLKFLLCNSWFKTIRTSYRGRGSVLKKWWRGPIVERVSKWEYTREAVHNVPFVKYFENWMLPYSPIFSRI